MRPHLTGLAIAASFLSGCGPPLGEYEVTDLRVVDGLPDAFGYRGPPQDYIQITLASDFDIVAEGNGNIYAFMGRCPFNADLERMVLGPLAAGEPPADLFGVGEVMPRRPDGRAGYVLYVDLAASERRKISNLPELAFGYDLVADREDLCLQIRQSGYFITASRSQTIRIPYSDIARTIAEATKSAPDDG